MVNIMPQTLHIPERTLAPNERSAGWASEPLQMVFVININNTGTKQGFTTCFIYLVQQQQEHITAGLHKYKVPDCPGGYSCMVTHSICGLSGWNLVHASHLLPRISGWLYYLFYKVTIWYYIFVSKFIINYRLQLLRVWFSAMT